METRILTLPCNLDIPQRPDICKEVGVQMDFLIRENWTRWTLSWWTIYNFLQRWTFHQDQADFNRTWFEKMFSSIPRHGPNLCIRLVHHSTWNVGVGRKGSTHQRWTSNLKQLTRIVFMFCGNSIQMCICK